MLRFDHLRTCSRHPRIWLAAQLLAVVAAGGVFGLWHLKLPLEGDSVSYVATSKMPSLQALTSMRTLGYPLLLKAVALVSPNYIVIPWIHLGMFCAAIFFFDFALRRFGASPWQAVLASSALIYALLPLRTPIGLVLTDFPGEVLAVTTVGCLFWIAAEPRRPLGWLLMTVCLLAAYQVRPVYLFLVPLTPCLGLWFMWLRTQHAGIAFAWKRPLAGLLAASCLPLAAFCLMRLALVGNFGLVSFAGYNLSGLAVEMLDSSLAERELPPRFRPLAREILKERQERGLHNAFVHGRWDLARYELNFSPNIYGIAVPTVKRLYGDEPTMVNRELADFSRQVIALRKGRYLLWVAYSIPRAAAKAACFDWIILPLAAIAALLCASPGDVFRLAGLRRLHRISRRAGYGVDVLPAGHIVLLLPGGSALPFRNLFGFSHCRAGGRVFAVLAGASDRRRVGAAPRPRSRARRARRDCCTSPPRCPLATRKPSSFPRCKSCGGRVGNC